MFSHSLPTVDAEVNLHLLDRDQQAPLASQEVTSCRDADATCLGLAQPTPSVGHPTTPTPAGVGQLASIAPQSFTEWLEAF